MKLKMAIIDDEQQQIDYLSGVVSAWANKSRHIADIKCYFSAKSFLFDYAEEKDFDILLLDIEMPELNGIELAKAVRRENSTVQIIFITGYYEYFSDGFDVSALHYLIKPADERKLLPVLERASESSASVEVDFTQVRHVRKPAGAKPGMVIYDHNRTALVAPDKALAQKLAKELLRLKKTVLWAFFMAYFFSRHKKRIFPFCTVCLKKTRSPTRCASEKESSASCSKVKVFCSVFHIKMCCLVLIATHGPSTRYALKKDFPWCSFGIDKAMLP